MRPIKVQSSIWVGDRRWGMNGLVVVKCRGMVGRRSELNY